MVGETADIVMAFYKCGIAHAGFYQVRVQQAAAPPPVWDAPYDGPYNGPDL